MSSIPLVPTPEVWQHILFGDVNGGGHLCGANIESKTEFPTDWHLSRIERAIESVQRNHIARHGEIRVGQLEGFVDGLVLRLILEEDEDGVLFLVTAYPIRGQGVHQNRGGKKVSRPLKDSDVEF